MAIGGALFELESILSVPAEARIGWWTMEWWWNQPDVPGIKTFDAAIRSRTGKAASASWFGYAGIRIDGRPPIRRSRSMPSCLPAGGIHIARGYRA